MDNPMQIHLRKSIGVAAHVPVPPHLPAFDRLILVAAKPHEPASSSHPRLHQLQAIQPIHIVVFACQIAVLYWLPPERFLYRQSNYLHYFILVVLDHSDHLEFLQARLAGVNLVKVFDVIATHLLCEVRSPDTTTATIFSRAPTIGYLYLNARSSSAELSHLETTTVIRRVNLTSGQSWLES